MPHARQVADPFHVVRLANSVLDEVRRRVQNDTLGGRGTTHDPLYRIRKLLVMAKERVAQAGQHKLRGLLAAGDPRGEVRDAWLAKEAVRDIYRIPTRRWAAAALGELARDLQDDAYGPELNRLLRTLAPPDHQLARLPSHQRTDRSSEQPRQTRQTCRVRIRQLRELPHPRPALRRTTRLDPPPNPHSPQIREVPRNLARRTEAAIERAKAEPDVAGKDELIAEAYSLMRSWCEVFVEQELFQSVTQRFRRHVMMTRLPRVRVAHLAPAIEVISEMFDEISGYILGHSHALRQSGTKPTEGKLERDWRKLQHAVDRYEDKEPGPPSHSR